MIKCSPPKGWERLKTSWQVERFVIFQVSLFLFLGQGCLERVCVCFRFQRVGLDLLLWKDTVISWSILIWMLKHYFKDYHRSIEIQRSLDTLVIFSITLMGHFKHNTPKQHSHTSTMHWLAHLFKLVVRLMLAHTFSTFLGSNLDWAW